MPRKAVAASGAGSHARAANAVGRTVLIPLALPLATPHLRRSHTNAAPTLGGLINGNGTTATPCVVPPSRTASCSSVSFRITPSPPCQWQHTPNLGVKAETRCARSPGRNAHGIAG